MKNSYKVFASNLLYASYPSTFAGCTNAPDKSQKPAWHPGFVKAFSLICATLFFCFFSATQVSAQLGTYTFNNALATTCGNMNKSVTTQPANASFSAFANSGNTCVASTTNYVTSNNNTKASYDKNKYVEFTITADPGYMLTLSKIQFSILASSNGSTQSTWSLRSSSDNYGADFATGNIKTASANVSVNLNTAAFVNQASVTFKIYTLNILLNTTTVSLDNVILTGVSNPIPADPADPTSNSPQCVRDQVTITRTGTPPAGIDWYWQTVPGGTDLTTRTNTYKVAASGTYYIRAYNSSTLLWSDGWGTISVIATPDLGPVLFAMGSSSTRCQGAASITYSASASDMFYVEYTIDGNSTNNGVTVDFNTGAVTFPAGWYGNTTVTAKAYGCGGNNNAKHTITTTPSVTAPVFGNGLVSVRCQGAGTATYTSTATNQTSITYALDATSKAGGNSIVAATGVLTFSAAYSGNISVIATANGCSPLSTTYAVYVTPTVGFPVFDIGAASSRCRGAGTGTYTATATTSTGMSYSLDATSLAAGNTINPATGVVTFVEPWFGTSTVTASATGCNGPRTSTHTITTNNYVAIPVFAAGSSSSICQASAATTYTATAANNTGITYSIDNASITGGNSVNSGSGKITWNNGWTGTTIVTAIATGCSGPQSSSHTITIIPTVGTPVFDLGTSSTICQASAPTTYTANATTTTGITYSINTTGAGNSISAATGQVTWAAGYSGNTIVTASAAGCNGPKTSTHTVTVTATVGTPIFTLGASSVRCQGVSTVTYTATATTSTGMSYALDATSVAAGNTINTANGAVTFVAGWYGSSTITATATGCNGPSVSSHTVTTNRSVTAPVFTGGSSSTICQNPGSITYPATANYQTSITYTLDATSLANGNTINAATGQVTYASAWYGTTTVTATANGCSPQSTTHTVTILQSVGTPVFALGASSIICRNSGTVTYVATAVSNTGISYTLDNTSLSAGNTINTATGAVTYTSTWTGTSTITATATGCNGPRTSTHSAFVRPDVLPPVFDNSISLTRCIRGENTSYTATASYTTGITYSLDAASVSAGNTINTNTGLVSWNNSWFGTTTITASAAGCYGPKTTSIDIVTYDKVGSVTFSVANNSTICQASGTVNYAATAYANLGMSYSLDATGLAGGNTINATTGDVTYSPSFSGQIKITANAAGCSPTSSSLTIKVIASVGTPVFSLGANSVRCPKAEVFSYNASATTSTGMTWSLDADATAAGNSIDPSSGKVTYLLLWADTAYITATATGCNGPVSATHTAITNPNVGPVVFALGNTSTRCQGAGSVPYSATATNNTLITYVLDNASKSGGNSINALTGVITWAAGWSGNSVITATADGCGTSTVATHMITTTPTVGTPVFAAGASSSRCYGAGVVTYSATSTNNTGLSFSLDAASLSAGNSINSLTGAVTYISTYAGISYITATATGCNGPVTTTHTASTNGQLQTPVFALGPNSARCQPGGGGSSTASFTATALYSTNITYSLDASSISAGNSINASTGTVTFKNSYSGVSTITATATGCTASTSATHTVTTNALVTTPVFSMGTASTVCQNPGTITYTATASNTTGITYSLNAASIAGGNTINANTGAVTYAPGWYGTTVITASAAGCSGPLTANHTVTLIASVGTPVFSSGAGSFRCKASGNVTYTASATTSTGMSYSLDATSLSAGNTISSSTGKVTYTAAWTGTSIITATATGCNGPVSSTHTAVTFNLLGPTSFAMGTSSTRCQGDGTVTYTATASDMFGVSYILDVTSRNAGNTIDGATGMVTWVAGWSGTSTITATASGCNGTTSATHTVTNTPTVGTPVFSLGATSSRCQLNNGSGSVSVTYSATATNSTGITYSLDAASIAGGLSINSANGSVSYIAGWSGTTIITANATGCNGPATSTHTVTVTPLVGTPVFAMGANSTRCQGSGTSIYSAAATNAVTINYTIDAASSSYGNTINSSTGAVTFLAGWNGTTTITASANGCSGVKTATHTISITPTVGTPVFSLGASSARCQGAGSVTYAATATNSTGITFSLDATSISGGNSIDAVTGQVTYTATWVGNTTITASATGCNGPAFSSHQVTTNPIIGTPVFSAGTSTSRCQGGGSVTYTATASGTTNISYSLDSYSAGFGNIINNATGTVNFSAGYSGNLTVTATANGCGGPKSATFMVTINPTVETPVFTAGGASSRCKVAETITYGATSVNSTSISYSLDATSASAGNTINSATGAVTYVATWSGTSTITATAYGCNGPDFAYHQVTTRNPVTAPVFSMGASSGICQGDQTITYTAAANNALSITYSLNDAALAYGNTIDENTGTVTYVASWKGATTITATANGCGGPLTAVHTVNITPVVPTPVFTGGETSSRCNGAGTVSYPATAATTITYSIDATSISAGVTINSSNGTVTYPTGWVGTTTISATAAGCGTPVAQHLATSTPNVGAPVFNKGLSSGRCQGAGASTYTATATNSTLISYSLDAASLAAGNSINASTGLVTFVAGWNNNSVVTATASGCNGPATSSHTITTSGNGTAVFDLGATSSRVQGAGVVTYNAVANNGSPVSYSLDGTSISAGNTINSSTGAVTYATNWSGNSIITATSSGCVGTVTSTHTATTNPNSVFKQLYLSDPAQALDRIDPVATNDNSTANTAVISNGGSVTFTQAPALCSALNIKVGQNIKVITYLTVNTGTMPATPAITAVLKYGSTNIITLSNPAYNSSNGTLTFTGALGADVLVPAGQSIVLVITSAQSGVTFTIQYDSQTKPSKIELPVSTFIDVNSLNVYNAPYPGGSIIDGAVSGYNCLRQGCSF